MTFDKKTIILAVLVVALIGIAVFYVGTINQIKKDFYVTGEVIARSLQNNVYFADKVTTLETKVNFLEEKVAGLEALSLPPVPAPPRP